jgi:hypothetical protein
MPGQNAHAEQETKGHGQRLDPALAQWRDVLEDRPYLICRGVMGHCHVPYSVGSKRRGGFTRTRTKLDRAAKEVVKAFGD